MALAKSRPMRDQLVDAAIDLFSTKGYAATSVADIQTACGLTAGSGALYKHFSSKEELLREVLRRHAAGIAHLLPNPRGAHRTHARRCRPGPVPGRMGRQRSTHPHPNRGWRRRRSAGRTSGRTARDMMASRLVITGPPGAGKSTVARFVAG